MFEFYEWCYPSAMRKFNTSRHKRKYADRLAIAIKYTGLSKKEFAQSVDLKENQLSNWLGGKQRVGLDAMLEISHVHNIPLSFIYEGKLSELDVKLKKFVLSQPRDEWAD